jgi:co-chaperonin GroES (HSP10)
MALALSEFGMSGVSIERKTSTFIAQDEKVKPLGDRIFVKPLDWDASKIVFAIREGRPVRGIALAVGPGRYQTRYNKDRSKLYETESYVPTTVKPGDIVEWGGLNIFDGQGYSFEEIAWGNERVLVITERDVCFIREAA